jgi:hypothetical protein
MVTAADVKKLKVQVRSFPSLITINWLMDCPVAS